MSNIDAMAADLFATVSAFVEKRMAPVIEKMADMQAKLDAYAKEDAERHESALEEISTTDASVAQLRELVAELKAVPPSKDGVDGKDGVPGVDGKDGQSVELTTLHAFVLDSVDAQVKALVIPAGKDGAPGKDAEPVDFDAMVKTVVATIPVPKDGDNGKDGEDGRDGRDAIQCDVLDVIDPERRYQRGTFATHKGGLIRAFRATDPMGDGAIEKAGWAVVVEGIAGFEVKQGDDLRTFAIGAELTSGKAFAEAFTLPVMIHRGVFKAGTEYVRGDVATWDGSSWHCEAATKSEPGNGADWKLIAKRGANGKDAVAIKGDPGPAGRNGKDLTQIGPDGAKW